MYIRHPINIIFGPTAANFPFHVGIVCSGGAVEENVCAVLPSDHFYHPSCSPCSFYLLKFSSFAISHYVNSARVRPTYSNVCGGWRERSRRPLYSLHVRGGGSRTTYDDEGKSSAHTTTHEVGQENERTDFQLN